MSTGSGTFSGYHLEVRVSEKTMHAYDCGGMIVTKEWQRVPITYGVPGFRSEIGTWTPHARSLQLLDYEVAKGIAAHFHAQHRQANWMLEFRLIREKVEWSFTATPNGEGEMFSFNDMERTEKFTTSEKAGKP